MNFPLDLDTLITLMPIGLLLFSFTWSGLPRGPEKFTAIWALLSGHIIHIWIEGVVCLTRRGPQWMIIKFDDFDTRYRDYEPNAMAMVWMELFFQGPFSVLWYHAIVNKLWYKPFVGILVCTSEIYGTAVFVIAETMDGFKHIVIDSWPPSLTSPNDFVNFWIIFVFASAMYTVWPTTIVIRYILEFWPDKDVEKKNLKPE